MISRTIHSIHPFHPPIHPGSILWFNRLQGKVNRVNSKLYKSLPETQAGIKDYVYCNKSFGLFYSPFSPTWVNCLILQIVTRVNCK